MCNEYIFIQHFMKLSSLQIALFSISLLLMFSSCRKEETQLIEPPKDETLVLNSPIVNLIKQAISNDGSVDNIIDNANCFKVKLPVTVSANNITIEVNTEMDYETIEDVFDDIDDDDDVIEIVFPITIILEDYSLVSINNYAELSNFSSNCNGENIADDDIECVDFQYPISASIFNSANEMIDTATFNKDEDFYGFIDEIDQYDIVTLDFPIVAKFSDGTTTNVQNLNELEAIMQTYQNSCDEDDDNNYDDDDCNECTTNQLMTYLTSCENWIVDRLRRDDSGNQEDYYDDYVFNFYSDGTVISTFSAWTYEGTWTATGSANNITVVIDIPTLPDCNNEWTLHEIEENPGETKIDFRLGEDQIRYVNDCN
jgi:hypothetical protein